MLRHLVALILFISFTNNGFCQGSAIGPDGKPMSVDLTMACSDPPAIFLVLEKPSGYKEGRKALIAALNEKVTLPKKVRGNVILMFLINCKGEASGFIVPKADDADIAKEVIEALTEIQGWQAGQQKEKPVDTYKTLSLGYKKGRFL